MFLPGLSAQSGRLALPSLPNQWVQLDQYPLPNQTALPVLPGQSGQFHHHCRQHRQAQSGLLGQ
jgi:hypothetical protein